RLAGGPASPRRGRELTTGIDHCLGVLVQPFPLSAVGQTFGQARSTLDADKVHASQPLLPSRSAAGNVHVFFYPLTALHLIAIIDPVEQSRPAVPCQVTAPVVGVEYHRPSASLLFPGPRPSNEFIHGAAGDDLLLVCGERPFHRLCPSEKE